jgi:hypothetical protein
MALTKVGSGVIQDDAVGIANLGATGTASATTFLRGDNSWAVAGGNNVPRFSVYASAAWDLSDNTWTLNPFDSADVNDDGASGTCVNITASGTNPRGFTVPAGQAGVYVLSYSINHYVISGAMENQKVSIYKGASGGAAAEYIGNNWYDDASVSDYVGLSASVIVDAAVGDHYYIYSLNTCGDTAGRVQGGRTYSNFSGFKLL